MWLYSLVVRRNVMTEKRGMINADRTATLGAIIKADIHEADIAMECVSTTHTE